MMEELIHILGVEPGTVIINTRGSVFLICKKENIDEKSSNNGLASNYEPWNLPQPVYKVKQLSLNNNH